MADEKSEEASEQKEQITIKIPKFSVPKNLWMISTFILLAFTLVLIAYPQLFGGMRTTGQAAVVGGLTEQQAADKAVDYINNNLVQTGEATLVDVEEMSGIYKVTTSYQGNQIDVYVTRDGKWLFPNERPIDMTTPVTTTTTTQPQEVPKSDRPEAHAFVMSYCPYGLQFLKAYVPVIELLGNKADLEVNFVNYAMHGETEVYENLRMYCIQAQQQDKFTEYLRCFVEAGDYEGCIGEVGIDNAALDTCMTETDEEFKTTEKLNDQSTWSGGSFPPFDIDTELCEQYGVTGSPTFLINGQTVNVNRSPEAIKQAVCNTFNTAPEECKQELSTTAEQPGLGPIGSGSGAPSGGQC